MVGTCWMAHHAPSKKTHCHLRRLRAWWAWLPPTLSRCTCTAAADQNYFTSCAVRSNVCAWARCAPASLPSSTRKLIYLVCWLAGWLIAGAVRICPLRSLLVQRLLIACLEMIIIVDAIKHFVIKRISLSAERCPCPSNPSSCIRVSYVGFPVDFSFALSIAFLRLFRLFLFFFCCFVLLHAVSSSEIITRFIIYNLQNTRSMWLAVCRIQHSYGHRMCATST